MAVTQRLFGVKCCGSFAQATDFVTAADGTTNIIGTTPIYFVNGVNNVAQNAPVEIDYTLFSVGTAATPIPPGAFVPSWYWLQAP